MFVKQIKLFRLFGFEVSVDLSWLVLAFLVTWTLAKGYFPHYHADFSGTAYWVMGVAGTLGLFFSIIFHEMCHSIVARAYGIPMKGITLFIFGGVAQMDDEPPSAKTEFLMAIAGPISSLFLALCFYIISGFLGNTTFSPETNAVFEYLAFINLVLALFNLLPGFPLDGGRVLRAALWHWKNNIRWATRIASEIGTGLGTLLIILGIFSLITGNFIGGLWWIVIGMFLRNASGMSYQQLALRKALEGEQVKRFMITDPVTVTSSTTLQQLVDDYFYHYHHKMYPVVDNSKLAGCVTIRGVKKIPREDWKTVTVGQVADACGPGNTIDINTDPVKALMLMSQTNNGRLMVLEEGNLMGILTLKDMMKFLSVKLDLEYDEDMLP